MSAILKIVSPTSFHFCTGTEHLKKKIQFQTEIKQFNKSGELRDINFPVSLRVRLAQFARCFELNLNFPQRSL